MKNPYYIDEPAVISFSGGRSSAYMLYKCIEAHNGKLPDYVKVCFANTGKEMPQTLDFVERCSQEWGVEIVWLEYTEKKGFKQVCFSSASRVGEPFAQLIKDRKYLPNMIARFCTSELKVLTIDRFMKAGGIDDYLTVVGIRADEQRRVAKHRQKEGYAIPLANSGHTERDVADFWENNSFDLSLPKADINTLSNCDLCFLKGGKIKRSIVEHKPELADWWAEQELLIGGYFRSDQPSYAQMKVIATDQGNLFEFGDDETISCFCGD